MNIEKFRPLAALACGLLGFALIASPAAAQEPVTITGRVTGPLGEPLRDVNVLILDLGLGAFTTPDGVYRLVVPGGRASGQQARLTARLIGHRAQSVLVSLASGAVLEQHFQ